MTEGDDLSGPVLLLYEDYLGLIEDVKDRSLSGLSALNRTYHKVILVAAASSLESQVKRIVESIFREHGRDELGNFIAKRVMARGYHQLFDWPNGTAKGFFSSFGTECADTFNALKKSDTEFAKQHSSFMRLGSLRNLLVHEDFATYALAETPEDLIALYRDAVLFPDRFEAIILPSLPLED